MAPETLERLVSEIRQLQPEDRAFVMEALQQSDVVADDNIEVEAFYKALAERGLVAEIKRPIPAARVPSPPLIHVSGEPVSETLIRERR